MATKKKVVTVDALTWATNLESIRNTIAQLKKEERETTKNLLDALHIEKIDQAGNYQISIKRTLKVKDEKLVLPWAVENGCYKIDTSKAKEILRHTFDSPEKYGFAVVESESIIPKGGRAEEE